MPFLFVLNFWTAVFNILHKKNERKEKKEADVQNLTGNLSLGKL